MDSSDSRSSAMIESLNEEESICDLNHGVSIIKKPIGEVSIKQTLAKL